MTLLKDNNYKEINIALLSLEADIKKLSKNNNFDAQLADINKRIDEINGIDETVVKNLKNDVIAINSDIDNIENDITTINTNIEGINTNIDNIEQQLANIFSAENKVTDFNTTTNSGIYYWITDAANRPTNYGVLLVNKRDDGGSSIWINQIAYGTDNKIYFRQNINSGNWTEWKAVAFEGHKHSASDITSGVLPVANGGTGVTTQADINKAFIGNLETSGSDVTDGTEFVSSYASDNGFAETANGALNKPYKRKFVNVWNYIKDKISSVLGLTKDNYSGTAAAVLDSYNRNTPIKVRWSGPGINSAEWYPAFNADGSALEPINRANIHAGTADTVDNYHASQLWRSDGATWNPSANVVMTPSGNDSEWSFDFRYKNGATGAYWQVWDENNSTLLRVNADDGKVSAPYGFVGNLSGKAASADSARNMYYQNLDLSALDKTKFYPAFCYCGDAFAEVAIHSPSLSESAEYNQNRIHFDISTWGWNDTPPTLNIREYACYDNNEITIGCIGRGVNQGSWAIWLRGGRTYACSTRNCELSLKTSDYTFGDETYTVGTNYYGGSNTHVSIMFTPQSTIKDGAYSSRQITAPCIKANSKMVIPTSEPATKENGCIWIG